MLTVLITGCSTGIGLATAEACLRAGYRVIATARKRHDLDALNALGAIPVQLDLREEHSVIAAVKTIENIASQIHVLFNNAGYGLQVAIEDASWGGLQNQLAANVIGPVVFTNALLHLIPSGGKIIFNSSILGLVTLPFRGPYCMSKYALEAAADAYRLELESKQIAVHVIQPGPIAAKFRENALHAILSEINPDETRLDYSGHLARLASNQHTNGTLPAARVAELVLAIISENKRRSRYLITFPAKFAAVAKRLLGNSFHRLARKSESIRER